MTPAWEHRDYFVLHVWQGDNEIIVPLFRYGENCALIRYSRTRYDLSAVPGDWSPRVLAKLHKWLRKRT